MRRLAVLGFTLLAAIAATSAVSGPARADTTQASPASCAVSYGSIAVWSGGFYVQIDVAFSGLPAGTGWVLTFDFASPQERIVQVPNEQWSQVGEHVVITNSSQVMPAAGLLPLSFIISYSTAAPLPVNYTLDGVACTAPIGVALSTR